MIVQFAAKSFDLSGYLAIEALPENNSGSLTRRVTVASTLDGGVAVNDSGLVHGDRELSFRFRPKDADSDAIARRLIELHPRVYVSTDDGLFECAPTSYNPDPSEREITLSVIEKF